MIARLFGHVHHGQETSFAALSGNETYCDVCSRGNTYSREHVALVPEQTEFWDFSWDEMATGDLPALFNYIIAASGQKQIGYVGAALESWCAICEDKGWNCKTARALSEVVFSVSLTTRRTFTGHNVRISRPSLRTRCCQPLYGRRCCLHQWRSCSTLTVRPSKSWPNLILTRSAAASPVSICSAA